MLLVDDILFSPVKGINWLFNKIHDLAQEELLGEADRIRESLTDLYMQLELGEITEAEFDEQEAVLLDRLEALEGEDNPDDTDFDATEDDSGANQT